jgi:hypothetical protein
LAIRNLIAHLKAGCEGQSPDADLAAVRVLEWVLEEPWREFVKEGYALDGDWQRAISNITDALVESGEVYRDGHSYRIHGEDEVYESARVAALAWWTDDNTEGL